MSTAPGGCAVGVAPTNGERRRVGLVGHPNCPSDGRVSVVGAGNGEHRHTYPICAMIVERATLIAMLEAYLAGQISAGELARRAFDMFYDLDQGALAIYEEDIDAVAEVLDELIFADDTRFALGEADVRRLIARLRQP